MTSDIKADLYRYKRLKGLKGFFKGILIPGFWYMYLLRKAAKSSKYSIGWFFFTFLKRIYSYKFGFQIPTTTQIGGGLHIAHFGHLIINGRAKIGKNCNLMPGVIIGQTNRGKLMGCPTIGDEVWIGSGSVIVGNIKIGSNVLIAPNSFVNINVPENSLVVGNPCKIIEKEFPCEGYICHVLNK
jgi:serine O-acetyltransferase